MIKKVIFLMCVVFSLCCCAQKTSFQSVTATDFDQLLKTETAAQLVDVRRPDEYAAGHIDNAVLINVQDADFMEKANALLDQSKPVAVYCKGGKRSKDAARKLAKEGYTVYELDSGYLGWVEYQQAKQSKP